MPWRAEAGGIILTRGTREGHSGKYCLSRKSVGGEGKENCFGLRAKAQWLHHTWCVERFAFRPGSQSPHGLEGL